MGETFNSTQPIYHQLVQRVCRQIVGGVLQAGEKLPSVRDFALQNSVNPNTVQRAYAELERLSVVETRRGLGTFVTEDAARLQDLREQLKDNQITAFVLDMKEMGFSSKEIMEGVEDHLAEDK